MSLKAPVDPLIAVVGATGTGKSKVHATFSLIGSKLMTADSLPSSWPSASMARSSMEMPCRCTRVCLS